MSYSLCVNQHNRTFRLVVRCSFVFASSNCYWLKEITWFILANHGCCLQKQMNIELQVERLYCKLFMFDFVIHQEVFVQVKVQWLAQIYYWLFDFVISQMEFVKVKEQWVTSVQITLYTNLNPTNVYVMDKRRLKRWSLTLCSNKVF